MDHLTRTALASIILGGDGEPDAQYPKYRSSWYLTMFFADAGFPDRVHQGEWRRQWVQQQLQSMDDEQVRRIVVRLALRREYETEEQWRRALELLNGVLAREGVSVTSDGFNVTFRNSVPEPPPSTDAHATSETDISTAPPPEAIGLTNRDVMVVYGRNAAMRTAMFDFLTSLGLRPLEWEQAVHLVSQGSPYIEDVVRSALMASGAVLVLLTGDDEARLIERHRGQTEPPYEIDLTPQARPNVILETGQALMAAPNKTIIVELERTRPISDIESRHRLRFDGSAASRNALANRLRSLGLPVDTVGQRWLTVGDFDAARGPANVPPGADDEPEPPTDPPNREEALAPLNVRVIRRQWMMVRLATERRIGRTGLLSRVTVAEYQPGEPAVLVLGVPISEVAELQSAVPVIEQELSAHFGVQLRVNINARFPDSAPAT